MRRGMIVGTFLILVSLLGCSDSTPKKEAPDSPAAQKEPPKVVDTPSPNKELLPLEWGGPRGWPTQITSGVPAYLAPVTYDPTVKILPVAEVWANLYAQLVKDPETQALFKRLHGDVPVTIVAMDAKAAAERGDKPPPVPPTPSAVHLAFRETMGRVAEGDTKCLIVTLSYSWFQAPPQRVWQEGKDTLKVYLLVINDYLLRSRSGYFLRHGYAGRTHQSPPGLLGGS